MARFGPAHARLGNEGLARALNALGIRQPGKPDKIITEEWIRYSAKPRENTKGRRATAKAHRDYISSELKGKTLKQLEIAREGTPRDEIRQQPLKISLGKYGDKYIGTWDKVNSAGHVTREVTKELTQRQIERFLSGSGLPAGATVWRWKVFGTYVTIAADGPYPVGHVSRDWYSGTIGADTVFAAFQAARDKQEAAVRAAVEGAIELGKAQGRIAGAKERLDAANRVRRGDPSDPLTYPPFGARFANELSPDTFAWTRVHAFALAVAR